jgi:hypothetical protein
MDLFPQERSMNEAETRDHLWGTVLAFDAIRQQIVNTCFIAEVKNFPYAKPGLRDFTEELKKLVARCETLLAGAGTEGTASM